MVALVVPDFVCQYGYYLFGCQFVDERIVQHDAFALAPTGKVGVGFGAAFRAVDDVNIVYLKIALLCKLFDGATQFAGFERCLFVE